MENYVALFTGSMNFMNPLLNSMIVAFSATAISVIIGALAAYSLSRFRFKLKLPILFWVLVTKVFPPVTLAIPLYMIMADIGLLNTRLALILAYIVFTLPFSIWMLINFFNEVSIEIEESAMIDGASYFKVFYKVVLPLVLPGIAATAIFNLILAWNEFLYALIFIQRPGLTTVPVSLAGLVTEHQVLWGPMSGGGVLSIIPIVIFVLWMQDYLVKGLTMGSVKG